MIVIHAGKEHHAAENVSTIHANQMHILDTPVLQKCIPV